MFRGERHRIAGLMASAGMPAVYDNKILVDAGGLMAYGVDTVKSFERSADLVVRLLRGTPVNDVPIEQPTPTFSHKSEDGEGPRNNNPSNAVVEDDEVIE